MSYYQPDHPYVEHVIRRGAARLYRKHGEGPVYVHVDPGMRYAADLVRRCLGARCVQLVRDGRKVVASMYPRKIYTKHAKTLPVMPGDPKLAAKWDQWPRFEKLCWHWRDGVEHLLTQGFPLLRFEELLSDYDLTDEILLKPSGIDLPREQWREACARPINATRFRVRWLMPNHVGRLRWNDDYERRFRALCGPTMEKLGYTLD
ncbi:MAG: hypothetical protein WD294_07890 [Phycisphaeraceae bacterium]